MSNTNSNVSDVLLEQAIGETMRVPDLDPTVLDELERLDREATPGPWRPCGANDGRCKCGLVWSLPVDRTIGSTADDGWPDGGTNPRRDADAALIALARTHLSALLRTARMNTICAAAPPVVDATASDMLLDRALEGMLCEPPAALAWAPGHDPREQPAAPASTTGHAPDPNLVHHPIHYNSHPSGIEAIEICEHLSFNLGNATKYLFRIDHNGNAARDRKKAAWYLRREADRDPSGKFALAFDGVDVPKGCLAAWEAKMQRVMDAEPKVSPLRDTLQQALYGSAPSYADTLRTIAYSLDPR